MKKVFTASVVCLILGVSIQAQSIVGNWKLTWLVIESDMVYSINAPITLSIEENGKFHAKGGCNTFSGSYTFKASKKPFKKPEKIKFTNITSAQLPCEKPQEAENVFLRSLKDAATVAFEKEELIIKNKATSIRSPHGNVLIQNSMSFVREAAAKP